jgi:hypothetical protein
LPRFFPFPPSWPVFFFIEFLKKLRIQSEVLSFFILQTLIGIIESAGCFLALVYLRNTTVFLPQSAFIGPAVLLQPLLGCGVFTAFFGIILFFFFRDKKREKVDCQPK